MKRLLILAAAIASAFAAHAQTYPGTKPVSIVVPFAAGGPTDRVARDLAIAMAKQILVFGDPDTVGEQLQACMDTGIDGLTINLPANGHHVERIGLLGEIGLAATAR